MNHILEIKIVVNCTFTILTAAVIYFMYCILTA